MPDKVYKCRTVIAACGTLTVVHEAKCNRSQTSKSIASCRDKQRFLSTSHGAQACFGHTRPSTNRYNRPLSEHTPFISGETFTAQKRKKYTTNYIIRIQYTILYSPSLYRPHVLMVKTCKSNRTKVHNI